MRRCHALIAIAAGLIVSCTFGFPVPVRAENLGPGGGTRIIVGDEIRGDYRLLVTASPEPAQVGKVTFVVRLTDPQSGERLKDAEISLDLRNPETGTALHDDVTHENAGSPVDFAAHMQIPEAGTWDGAMHISGPNGSVDIEFAQRIVPQRNLKTVLIIGIPFLVIIGVLGGFWFLRSSKPAAGEPR